MTDTDSNGAQSTGSQSTGSTTPAGWYDDGSGLHRYWDGADWTEHTHAPDVPRKRPIWPWILAGSALLTILAVIGGFVLFGLAIASTISATTVGPTTAVELHHQAYLDQDCDAFMAATSSQFRILTSTQTCEEFDELASAFADGSAEWDLSVTSTNVSGDNAVVVTDETFSRDGETYSATTTYELIRSGDVWKIVTLSADQG